MKPKVCKCGVETHYVKYYCRDCKKFVAAILEGSKLLKGASFLCYECKSKKDSGNLFNNLFGGLK